MLYPFIFKPALKERIWGGNALIDLRGGANSKSGSPIGESWEVSGVEGDISVIVNGFLEGNNLQEAVEVYMGELVGDKVFARFGEEFPLLIKYIDAQDKLSVQVHPDDRLAAARHGAYGKTEMWYVLDCEPGAQLLIGFKDGVTREIYEAAIADGTVGKLLNAIPVKPGDVYFIPAGTVHAIGKGLLIAEIQQTSDITYRVFDWNRTDSEGNPRELHTELAVDAIDFTAPVRNVTQSPPAGEAALLIECPYFTTNVVDVAGRCERELASRDSFTIYICTDGEMTLTAPGGSATLSKFDIVMLPADQDNAVLEGYGKLLETYI
jgi:mannose-6-phosphate isomerase